ncbi:MAG: hypothetical protein ACRCST_00725 [Turicibacter sp.]
MGMSANKLKLPKVNPKIGKTFYTPEVMEVIVALHIVFQDGKDPFEKMAAWMNFKNLNLGGISPAEMIVYGRSKRLLQAVNDMMEGE